MLEPQGNGVLIQSSLFSDAEAKPWGRGSFNVLAFHGCVSVFPQLSSKDLEVPQTPAHVE